MKALYFTEFGTSDVLQYGDLPEPQIKSDEILLQTKYVGLNYADIYRRRGTYHLEPHRPFINGYESMGTIVKIGESVRDFAIGDRIMAVDVPLANAELVAVTEDHAIKIPKEIDDQTAATIGLQGLTADFLAHDLARNGVGDQVLIHGISGGVGQLLSQMLTADGAVAYGVVSNENKRQQALKLGAKEVFIRGSDWEKSYRGFFETVFDGAGVTLPVSLELIKHKGDVVFYGMAGGNPAPVDPIKLLESSKSLLTGDLWDYLDSKKERQARADRLFEYVINGGIRISKPTFFSLKEGKLAHQLLESGQSTGKILLEP